MSHRIALATALAVTLALPIQVQAQSETPPQNQPQTPPQTQAQTQVQTQAEPDAGRSLMERGAELFFEGLQREMAPALNDLRGLAEQFGPSMHGFFEEMGPAFASILDEVKDWSQYHPPEILPNGDIIIRRKAEPDGKDETSRPSGPTDI